MTGFWFVPRAAIGLAAALTLVSSAVPAHATVAGKNGRLAFMRSDGAISLTLVRPDGSGLTRISSAGNSLGFPDWSPDGSRIAFAAEVSGNTDIYIKTPGERGRTRLTRSFARDIQAAWSPDGTKLVVTSLRIHHQADLFLINADGTGIRRLTRSPAFDGYAQWAPGGRRIAFESRRHGFQAIYLMRPDGTHVHRITPRSLGAGGRPDWSPNGRWIAFSSHWQIPGPSNIYLIHPGGGGLQQITHHGLRHSAFDPCFSPNGRRLAFDDNRIRDFSIYVKNLVTGTLHRVTNGHFDILPDWGARA